MAAQQQKFTLLYVLLSARNLQGFIDIIFVLHLVATKLLALGYQASKLTQVQDMHCVFPLVLSFPQLQGQAMAVLCKKGSCNLHLLMMAAWCHFHHRFSFPLALHRLHQIGLCSHSKNIMSSLSPVYYLGTTQGCKPKFTPLNCQSFVCNTHTPCTTLNLDWSPNKIYDSHM